MNGSASTRTLRVVLETNKRPSSLRQRRVCWQTKSLNSPREREVAEETMSALVKLAKHPLEPHDIDQPTAEWRDLALPLPVWVSSCVFDWPCLFTCACFCVFLSAFPLPVWVCFVFFVGLAPSRVGVFASPPYPPFVSICVFLPPLIVCLLPSSLLACVPPPPSFPFFVCVCFPLSLPLHVCVRLSSSLW